MITMTLNTDAVRKALIQYLETDLNMNVTGKAIDVSVVVGRKSSEKPVPDITATVNISDIEARIGNNVEVASKPNNVVTDETQGVSDFDVMPKGNPLIEATEDDDEEEDVAMPAETPESELGQPSTDVNPFEEIEEEVSQPAKSSSSMFG